jgi:hypothetical protein
MGKVTKGRLPTTTCRRREAPQYPKGVAPERAASVGAALTYLKLTGANRGIAPPTTQAGLAALWNSTYQGHPTSNFNDVGPHSDRGTVSFVNNTGPNKQRGRSSFGRLLTPT